MMFLKKLFDSKLKIAIGVVVVVVLGLLITTNGLKDFRGMLYNLDYNLNPEMRNQAEEAGRFLRIENLDPAYTDSEWLYATDNNPPWKVVVADIDNPVELTGGGLLEVQKPDGVGELQVLALILEEGLSLYETEIYSLQTFYLNEAHSSYKVALPSFNEERKDVKLLLLSTENNILNENLHGDDLAFLKDLLGIEANSAARPTAEMLVQIFPLRLSNEDVIENGNDESLGLIKMDNQEVEFRGGVEGGVEAGADGAIVLRDFEVVAEVAAQTTPDHADIRFRLISNQLYVGYTPNLRIVNATNNYTYLHQPVRYDFANFESPQDIIFEMYLEDELDFNRNSNFLRKRFQLEIVPLRFADGGVVEAPARVTLLDGEVIDPPEEGVEFHKADTVITVSKEQTSKLQVRKSNEAESVIVLSSNQELNAETRASMLKLVTDLYQAKEAKEYKLTLIDLLDFQFNQHTENLGEVGLVGFSEFPNDRNEVSFWLNNAGVQAKNEDKRLADYLTFNNSEVETLTYLVIEMANNHPVRSYEFEVSSGEVDVTEEDEDSSEEVVIEEGCMVRLVDGKMIIKSEPGKDPVEIVATDQMKGVFEKVGTSELDCARLRPDKTRQGNSDTKSINQANLHLRPGIKTELPDGEVSVINQPVVPSADADQQDPVEEEPVSVAAPPRRTTGGGGGGGGGTVSSGGGGSVVSSGYARASVGCPAGASIYADLTAGHSAFEAVKFVTDLGVFTGKPNPNKECNLNLIDLNAPFNRAEQLKMALTLYAKYVDSGIVNVAYESALGNLGFRDFDAANRDNAWLLNVATQGKKTGLFMGYADQTIRFGNRVSEAEALKTVVIGLNLVKAEQLNTGGNPWYLPVYNLVKAKSLNFQSPDRQLSRADVIDLLYRFEKAGVWGK